MNQLEKYFYSHLNLIRRNMQLITLLFILAVPVLNLLGYKQIIGTLYSIRIGGLDIIDPALMLQNILLTKSVLIPLVLASLLPMVLAFFFGKVFCSWMCPFNFIAEYVYKIRKTLFRTSKFINKNPRPYIYWIIYGTIFIAMAVTSLPLVTLISIPGLISAQIADVVLFGSLGLEIVAIPAILVIELLSPERVWCKYICPVGASLAILKSKNRMSIKYFPHHCSMQCSANKNISMCNEVCPLQLNPRQAGLYPYCYNCGACVKICQSTGGQAIYFTFNRSSKESAKNI